jgi:hypothetical protein
LARNLASRGATIQPGVSDEKASKRAGAVVVVYLFISVHKKKERRKIDGEEGGKEK